MITVLRRASVPFLLALLCLLSLPLYAQESPPAPGRDIAVILDVSGSMEEGLIIREVKDWIAGELLRSRTRPGDRFSMIAFGTRVRVLMKREIAGPADIESLVAELETLRTRDHFTDIGSALEGFDRFLESLEGAPRKPLAIFITDGKNAPPDFSPWYGKDLSADGHFKDIGNKIAQRGWVLYVVGLLDDSDAALVAETVPGSTLAQGDDALDSEPLDEYIEEREEAALPQEEPESIGLDGASEPSMDAQEEGDDSAGEAVPETPPPLYRFEADEAVLDEKADEEGLFSYRGLILAAVAFVVLAFTALLVGGGMRHRSRDGDNLPKRKVKKAKVPKPKREKVARRAKPAKAPKAPKADKNASKAGASGALGGGAAALAGFEDEGASLGAGDDEAELAALLAPGPAPKDGPVVASPEAEDLFADFSLE